MQSYTIQSNEVAPRLLCPVNDISFHYDRSSHRLGVEKLRASESNFAVCKTFVSCFHSVTGDIFMEKKSCLNDHSLICHYLTSHVSYFMY